VNRRGIWADSGIRIRGFGHYYPRQLIHNDLRSLDTMPSSEVDDKILGRISVRSRHRADERETVLVMAVEAAAEAVKRAEVDPAELDLVLLTNWTDRLYAPEMAPQVAYAIGARRALGFDLCGACTGFVHAVQTAAAYLLSPTALRTALIVSSERFSRRVRPGSRGELVAGDAAAAAVLERGDPAVPGLLDSVLHSKGEYADLTVGQPPDGWVRSRPGLVEQAVQSITETVSELLDRNGLDIADIDWLVPHSGTAPIFTTIQEKIGIAPEKFVTNFETRANTSSASIPVVLSENCANGTFRRGDLFLTPAVGGGWFYGGLLFRL